MEGVRGKVGRKVLDTYNATILIHEPSLRVSFVDVLANPVLSTTFLLPLVSLP